MKKIKLCFLINELYMGGAERSLYDVARSLDHEKYEISVLIILPVDKNRLTFIEDFEKLGIQVTHVATFFDLFKYLRKNKPDILHCHLPLSSIYGTAAARLAGVSKIIVHEHNTPRFYSWKIRAACRFLRPLVSLTICYSESVEKEMFGRVHRLALPLRELDSKSCTVPNGIDLSLIDSLANKRSEVLSELGLESDDILLISVARMVAWKGHANLVEALAKIEDARIKLLLVGSGPEKKNLESLAKSLGVSEKIFFLGNRQDVYRLLGASDIFSLVFSYPKDFSSEGLGIAGLEAMSAKLPVIVADYPETHRLIKHLDNGFIVKPEEPAALAQAVEKLATDQGLRQELGIRAREYIEQNYSLGQIATILDRVYSLIHSK